MRHTWRSARTPAAGRSRGRGGQAPRTPAAGRGASGWRRALARWAARRLHLRPACVQGLLPLPGGLALSRPALGDHEPGEGGHGPLDQEPENQRRQVGQGGVPEGAEDHLDVGEAVVVLRVGGQGLDDDGVHEVGPVGQLGQRGPEAQREHPVEERQVLVVAGEDDDEDARRPDGPAEGDEHSVLPRRPILRLPRRGRGPRAVFVPGGQEEDDGRERHGDRAAQQDRGDRAARAGLRAALQPPHGPGAAEADEEDRQPGVELGVDVVLVDELVGPEERVLEVVVQHLLDGHRQTHHGDEEDGHPGNRRSPLPDVEQHHPDDREEHVQAQVPGVAHAPLRAVPGEDGADEEELRPPRVVAAVLEDVVLEPGGEGPEAPVRRDQHIDHHREAQARQQARVAEGRSEDDGGRPGHAHEGEEEPADEEEGVHADLAGEDDVDERAGVVGVQAHGALPQALHVAEARDQHGLRDAVAHDDEEHGDDAEPVQAVRGPVGLRLGERGPAAVGAEDREGPQELQTQRWRRGGRRPAVALEDGAVHHDCREEGGNRDGCSGALAPRQAVVLVVEGVRVDHRERRRGEVETRVLPGEADGLRHPRHRAIPEGQQVPQHGEVLVPAGRGEAHAKLARRSGLPDHEVYHEELRGDAEGLLDVPADLVLACVEGKVLPRRNEHLGHDVGVASDLQEGVPTGPHRPETHWPFQHALGQRQRRCWLQAQGQEEPNSSNAGGHRPRNC
mmetsp:Transcript_50138/g.157966  ORF Transcript_50138/g.157966 Transcript_50138/m.157966 type:complete len:732 (+) Transcript_50138:248-2443(+)